MDVAGFVLIMCIGTGPKASAFSKHVGYTVGQTIEECHSLGRKNTEMLSAFENVHYICRPRQKHDFVNMRTKQDRKECAAK